MKILFENAILMTNDDTVSVLENAFLAVENDRITYMGTDRPKGEFDLEKNMKNKMLIPGLINGHTHIPMSLLRGVGSELPLESWLKEAVFPIENKLTRQDISIGTRIGLMEMLACGTTSFSDMYFSAETIVEEVVGAKMKANLSRAIVSFDPNEKGKDNQSIIESLKLFEEFNGFDNGRILIDFAIHAEYTSTEAAAKYYIDRCKAVNGHIHLHLSETEKEHNECKARHGKTPTQWFHDLGAFDLSTQLAHCVALESGDMDMLKDKNVTVIHNPTSNMKLGSGFAKVPVLIEKGFNLSLGTDGAASNNNINMFEEMHIASIIHKGKTKDPTLVKPEEVFKMVTSNGARMQRRNDTGVLAVGKKADIVAIDLDKPHLMPATDLLALMMYSVQASDVCMTMIDGQILYENGIYHTIDAEKVRFDLQKAMGRLYG